VNNDWLTALCLNRRSRKLDVGLTALPNPMSPDQLQSFVTSIGLAVFLFAFVVAALINLD
jgi:hypothetical protein